MNLKHMGLITLLIVCALFINGCGKTSDSKGLDLSVTHVPEAVTDLLYIKLNYAFTVTDAFEAWPEADEYKVFVHFWRVKSKEMLLVDDHEPGKKISQWKKGDTFEYSRIIFIPRFLDEFDLDFEGLEEVKLSVGLYDPKNKDSKITLFQESLNIQSASLNAPEIVYDEGWHQQETDLKVKDEDERSWRWTSKRAVCMIEKSKKDCLLKIRGGVDKLKFEDQKVIIKINDKVLEEFVPETAKFDKEYVIAPEMIGSEDEFRLIIETDKVFVPSQLDPNVNDDRELGVQVFFLYFRENVK